MKLLFVNSVVLLLFNSVFSAVSLQIFAEPIKHLLNSVQSPLMVTAMVCWKIDDKLKFAREFFKYSAKGSRDYQFAMTDVTIEDLPKVHEPHQQLIIVDLSCNQTLLLLEQIGMKLTQLKWIVLDNGDEAISKAFHSLPALVNSEIFCISRAKIDSFVIRQVYKTSVESPMKIEFYGEYGSGKLLRYRSGASIVSRRRDLHRQLLRATLVVTNNDTLNHLEDYKDKHIDTISKVHYFVTNCLIDYVNAQVQYSFVNSWGYLNTETGYWTGMIGYLVDNRSDIGASALFFTADRIPYIEYIAMPTATRSKFVFRSPKLSYTENVFLLPFHYFVWYSLIGLIIIISMLLFVATFAEWKLISAAEKSEVNYNLLRPSVMDVLFLVFGATFQQGSSVAPRILPSRIIMMLIFTTFMFLYTSYSANIVALLQSPSSKIRTLEDLLNSRLQLGVDDTVFNRYYFSHATEPNRKQIYERKILNKDGTENFISLEKGVAGIRKGLFAFHMETGVGYKIVGETFLEDEKCGLQEIQYLQVIDPWYAIQKNSSYKDLLKVGMMRIREHGLQERVNWKLYTRKPKCSASGGKFVTASLIDTRPALLVLLWGFLVSFFIWILEILYSKNIFKQLINTCLTNLKSLLMKKSSENNEH